MRDSFKTEPIIIKGGNISNEKLLELLKTPKKKKFFCFHKWIYWKFKGSTRDRRVCLKCYKKQQNKELFSKGVCELYVKDVKFN